jgi:uncharacterized protein
MEMTGEHLIAAPLQRVWAALNDARILRQSIEGCEELEKVSDHEFTAKVTAKVGPVKAKFNGKVTLSEIEAPNGYTISGQGSGGAAGFAKGSATVRLTQDARGTRLAYTVKAETGGKLAQLGSRLIDSTAKKMADDFFSRFTALVDEPEVEAGATEALEQAAPQAASGLSRYIPLLLIAAAAVAVAGYLIF